MEVVLTPAQENLIDDAVREGRLSGPEDAMRHAMALWERQELELRHLRAELAESDAQLESGDYIELNNEGEIHEFFEDVKRRGRAALAARSSQRQ